MTIEWFRDLERDERVLRVRFSEREARIHALDPRSKLMQSTPFRDEDLPRILRAIADGYEAELEAER